MVLLKSESRPIEKLSILFSLKISFILSRDFLSDAKIMAFSLFLTKELILKMKFSIFLLKFSCSIDFNSIIFFAFIILLFFNKLEEFIIG